MELRAIFFDAGETLLSPHPSFPELFEEVLREEGRSLDPGRIGSVVSASSGYFTELFRSEEGRLWSTSPERSRAMWDAVYRHFLGQLEVPQEEHERLVEALYARFTDPGSYRLQPDALPLLDRLAGSRLLLGLISNFEAWLEQLLEHLGVADRFEVTVISGREGMEKPDRRIFDLALERGGVRAGESVYVGDHPFFDVEASALAGMRPVLIDRRNRYPDSEALRVRSLEEVPDVLGLDA